MPIRRSSTALFASLGLTVAIAALSLGAILEMRRDALEVASANGHNIALLVQRDIQRNLDLYAMTLEAVVHAHAQPEVRALSSEVRDSLLKDYTAPTRGMGSVFITNADGLATFSYGKEVPARIDLSSREYFQAQRDASGQSLFLSHPYQPFSTNAEASIALSRRLERADGSFAGVVAANLELSYFRELFSGLNLGDGGAVSLHMRDGTLLAHWPESAPEPARTGAFKHFMASHQEIFFDTGSDGQERWHDFRPVEGYPLVFSVALPSREIYADWYWRASLIGVLGIALVGAVLGLALLALRQMRERDRQEAELRRAASTDPLTGLNNRRAFDLRANHEWSRYQRSGAPLSVMLMDIDKFKAYNDHYGHPAGDAALQTVARVIAEWSRRPADCAARFGGEEFVVLLGDSGEADALELAERIRAALQALAVPHEYGPLGVLTLSIGVASTSRFSPADWAELLQSADSALYQAKNGGRNQVVSFRSAAVQAS
ncbi:sensor domain-containing diguanylate cyclase [Pseudomonas nitroreducens]|uniref:sensor domain-containing diguanylate cyclase n=1 Tax=Pseudomonas nitroreducens TaxID=46680 RepID=UPI0020A12686|nr:sensor domain-containing diguanylate cyclase [Pseudomonas nitroreducens]MCP1625361.1 diguanylate cyclase (GGDEF)-like protein [Pseudomonas nitroreducens]